jgi:hypothetical protein
MRVRKNAHRILVGKLGGWILLAGRGIDHWFLNCGL